MSALNKLTLRNKKLFGRFLNLKARELSAYAFVNIYIWKAIFDIYWALIKDNLCVFFRDEAGIFAYLPPQGKKIEPEVIAEAFKIMDGFNRNNDISRIENIESGDLAFYRGLRLKCRFKSFDYFCSQIDMAELKGDKFKSKRAGFNYFTKHYKFEYLSFLPRYRNACLKLYDIWAKERKNKTKDGVYQGMLSDSRKCLKVLLKDYPHLALTGRIVKINRAVKAFTFGFKLNADTFCILYEVADLSVKGIAQFIFRQFCADLKAYKYINIMDDSGLENLKKTKLSYRPVKLIPSYIVRR